MTTPALTGKRLDLLTIPEVIAELRITRSTFYGWRATGKGPKCHRLPNGGLRVRRTDLDRWLNALEDNE
ncbi:hypothetical protein Cme02nite_26000 [Catellatospora methionotrophica]|uniref:Helix-turn-helix domain-containing protein n=1 Tax=Catellatospora methionotrophica TaxID=121620 RepID=A0A8J3PFE1_9ACTN|nr:helix-turn-helix domain-containing protein [Catellatospora methionotrophica]GIG14268.1 hypothetical protein Cme02nite_26000 [Catellatospora methionotrophica]